MAPKHPQRRPYPHDDEYGSSKKPRANNDNRANTRISKKEAIWSDHEKLLASEKSPLWDLTESELMRILLSPQTSSLLSPTLLTKLQSLSDQELREAMRSFKTMGTQGYFDKEWIEQAVVAGQTREEGGFEEWERGRFEDEWGVSDEREENMGGNGEEGMGEDSEDELAGEQRGLGLGLGGGGVCGGMEQNGSSESGEGAISTGDVGERTIVRDSEDSGGDVDAATNKEEIKPAAEDLTEAEAKAEDIHDAAQSSEVKPVDTDVAMPDIEAEVEAQEKSTDHIAGSEPKGAEDEMHGVTVEANAMEEHSITSELEAKSVADDMFNVESSSMEVTVEKIPDLEANDVVQPVTEEVRVEGDEKNKGGETVEGEAAEISENANGA